MCGSSVYNDTTFYGNDTLYWNGYSDLSKISNTAGTGYNDYQKTGTYAFMSVSSRYPNANLYPSAGGFKFNQVNQGGLGTCYMISSFAAMAEWSNRIQNIFISGSQKTNNKIYGARFFIRGKPWVVAVDDNLLFQMSPSDGNHTLVFAGMSDDLSSFWAPILEKAWIKVTGNSLMSEGGDN